MSEIEPDNPTPEPPEPPELPEVPDSAATTPEPVEPQRSSRVKRWALPTIALGLVALLAWNIYGKLREEVWAFYTDDVGTRVEVQEDKARKVLWQDPKQNVFTEKRDPAAPAAIDPVNQPGGRLEASFSPDGTMMVVVRWSSNKLDTEVGEEEKSSQSADMYMSRWNGRVWTRPTPIAEINTESNERGPALSRDGRYLFFSSDRDDAATSGGGKGGYDLYVARWDGLKWTGVETLGDAINTASHELGPALSADGSKLYFSSDRGGGTTEDIYVASRVGEPAEEIEPVAPEDEPETPTDDTNKKKQKKQKKTKKKKKQPLQEIKTNLPPGTPHPLPPMPAYENVQPVGHLNSAADDVQAALTARGDHVFLASDRDRKKDTTGFGVYFSRVVEGKTLPPEKVDLYIKKGNATDPAVRMEGFDLLFSTDIELSEQQEAKAENFRLYRSTTREVIGWTDMSRWEQFKQLLSRIGWWILLAIAALIALLYLLEAWQDITSLFHKCLAGSVGAHLLFLLLAMIWLIAQELDTGGEEQSPEIAITIDALAQEELALESEPENVQMADSKVVLVTEKLQSDFKIPQFKPIQNTKTAPIITSTQKLSLVQDVRPSKANETPNQLPIPIPTVQSQLLKTLPDIALPELEQPKLEESDAIEEQKAVEPADPSSEKFTPTKVIPQIATKQAQEKQIKEAAVKESTEAKEVETGGQTTQTKDTSGDLINPHRGLLADGSPPKLDGVGNIANTLLNLGGPDSQSDPLLPGNLETPPELDGKALTKLIKKQRGKPSPETIKHMGGTDGTEKAIGDAIEWLYRNQEPDGRWDVRKHESKGNYDTAGTGLALLCFYGWDIKHTAPGKYQNTVQKALDWLVKQQKENGDLRGGGRMYCHGIATIALCEAYGLTKDPKLKEPAQKAIDLIVASQSPQKGGWRYEPRATNDADTSVTGWQYMALHSAVMADLDVPEETFTKAKKWFDFAGGGRHGGIYGYTGPANNKPAMVATGMFCRQLDLAHPTEPRMMESAELLKMHPMKSSPDFYYVYYATLALYQHQGPIWKKWNETHLQKDLLNLQQKTGDKRGSWDPHRGHGATGGRVVSTALCVLSLEVYYRLLPMYGFHNEDLAPAVKVKGKISK